MAGQRTWHRVEAPGTYRGHALEAMIDGNHWYAWENPDGSWSLRRNGAGPEIEDNWAAVRRAAEGPAKNPMAPAVATAAAAGMAMAMRHHLINNPAPAPVVDRCDAALAALGVLGQVGVGGTRYMAAPPRCDRYGNLWVLVRRGYARMARRQIKRLRLGVPVRIMETAL